MSQDFLSNLIQYGKQYMGRIGPAWSQSNAEFEATQPTLMGRVIRTVNPMIGFGSALGAMHDAASSGFPARDTAIALMQSAPTFGAVLTKAGIATGASKAIPTTLANDYLKTLGSFAGGASASVAADEVQANDSNKKPKAK